MIRIPQIFVYVLFVGSDGSGASVGFLRLLGLVGCLGWFGAM